MLVGRLFLQKTTVSLVYPLEIYSKQPVMEHCLKLCSYTCSLLKIYMACYMHAHTSLEKPQK